MKMKEGQKGFFTVGTPHIFIIFIVSPTLGGREDVGNPDFYRFTPSKNF